MAIDFDGAAATLRELFEEIQQRILQGTALPIADDLAPAFETIFATPIQSYREALLGIVVARLQDQTISLRLPYVNQGPTAYNGRMLDEEVVNPFLHQHRIPASRGPHHGP
jgi:hypothetical protein